MGRRAILVDVNQCIGCQMCVEGCQEANGHPVHVSEGFSEQSFTFLMDRGDDVYVRRLCMHCEDPSCVSVCPVAALIKEPQGQVTYDAGKCMGCRYCMLACPFGVPSYEWYSAMPRVRKCEMCVHRGDEGPACAEVCPTEATLWGDRDQLIAEAESRLANSPEEYYPYIYGLKEAGGTDVFFIGPRNPGELGLPQVGHTPMPELTWRALRFVPDVAIFGGVLLGGMFWLTKRKADVADAEHRQEAPRDR
jgi:formate dehydrogenase iron-sulfur subunit